MNRNHGLTPRHKVVLYWATLGKTNQEIADLLEIHITSVTEYFKQIYRILDAKNRANATAIAIQNNLLDDFITAFEGK